MSIWLDDVRDYLIATGVCGGSTNWPIYLAYLTDDQDQTVSLFTTGGTAPETLDETFLRVGMQIRVRAGKLAFSEAYNKWKDCFTALQHAREGTFGSTLTGFIYILAVQVEPISFTDENGRINLASGWDILIAKR